MEIQDSRRRVAISRYMNILLRADQYESLMARLEQQLLDCLHQFAIHYVNDREERLVCLLAFPHLMECGPLDGWR